MPSFFKCTRIAIDPAIRSEFFVEQAVRARPLTQRISIGTQRFPLNQ